MRIIDLIQHKSRHDTTQVHGLDTKKDQSLYYSQNSAWYYSQDQQYNIITSIIWVYLGPDTT